MARARWRRLPRFFFFFLFFFCLVCCATASSRLHYHQAPTHPQLSIRLYMQRKLSAGLHAYAVVVAGHEMLIEHMQRGDGGHGVRPRATLHKPGRQK